MSQQPAFPAGKLGNSSFQFELEAQTTLPIVLPLGVGGGGGGKGIPRGPGGAGKGMCMSVPHSWRRRVVGTRAERQSWRVTSPPPPKVGFQYHPEQCWTNVLASDKLFPSSAPFPSHPFSL